MLISSQYSSIHRRSFPKSGKFVFNLPEPSMSLLMYSSGLSSKTSSSSSEIKKVNNDMVCQFKFYIITCSEGNWIQINKYLFISYNIYHINRILQHHIKTEICTVKDKIDKTIKLQIQIIKTFITKQYEKEQEEIACHNKLDNFCSDLHTTIKSGKYWQPTTEKLLT